MALDSMQKRMSAIAPGSPWRGPMVDATESGFNAGNRAAAAFMYSGLVGGGVPAITGTSAIVLAAIAVEAAGTIEAVITAPAGGDDAWVRKQVRAYRKRLKEWEQAEEAYERARREEPERLADELKAIYERIVEGKESASVIAATQAVAPYIARRAPTDAPAVDWASLLRSTDAIKDLLRAYGERDKFLRRERARRRNAALVALMLDG